MILSSHGIIGSSIVQFVPDSDYQAVLDYATTQGYTLPSASQQLLQNQLVVDLKSAGVWSKLDSFAVFATDGDSDFGLIDWIRLTDYTAVNSPTFTTNQGFTGNGNSSYINTNFNLLNDSTNYTQNDACRYLYNKTISNSNAYDSSNDDLTSNQNSLSDTMRPVNTDRNCRINTPGLVNTAYTYTTAAGMKSIHRTSSGTVEAFIDKTQTSRTSASTSIRNTNQLISRGGIFYNTSQISMYAIGSSLVSENDDFVDAFDTYLTSL
jgi:hypothetical protein